MNDRQNKLKVFKAKKELNKLPVIADGKPFIEAFENKVIEFKQILDSGIEVKADNLLEELNNITYLHDDILTLTKSIDDLYLPSYPKKIKIDGLDSLAKTLKYLQGKELDLKPVQKVADNLDKLNKKIADIQVPKQGQQPGDYIPTRRVMKVGNTLMYDDSFYTGGGGGSNIPTKNGSLPVVNPDGSNIGGSGIITNDGTFATPARQDTGNTSLASIDTKTPALGQALAAGSVPVILPSATITTLTPPAAITGYATSAKQDTGNTSLAAVKTDLDKFNFSSTPVGNESALIATVNPQSITKKTFTLNTSGDNTLYTPASGKSIKLLWYNITSSAANATSTIVILKIGTTSVDTQSLSASQPFAHTVGGGRGFYDGGANNAIIVNSSNNNTLYCNFEFLEI